MQAVMLSSLLVLEAGITAVACVTAAAFIPAIVAFPADPGVPILVGVFTYCTMRHIRLSDYRVIELQLTNYKNIEDWRIRETSIADP
jgi:hypothetical protein